MIHLIIKCQDSPDSKPYTQEFMVPVTKNMNVVTALMEIKKNRVTKDGQTVNPVAWDCNCLEEVCGACSMRINGKARQACSALIADLEQPIKLEPLTKFPVMRDLIVDRSKMFEALKKLKAWVDIDGSFDVGRGPRLPRHKQEEVYPISKCMTCGCCLEVCPNYDKDADFLGPGPIAQVKLFNTHPIGNMQKADRLEILKEKGGIASCGNAQNCVQACPKQIPLTDALGKLNREVNIFTLSRFFDF